MQEFFRRFAHTASLAVGSAWAFIVATLVIIGWAFSGPLFGFSDTWQLVINTSTTIVTFLMVFLIQNTQNRDAKSIHLKLDELLRGVTGARTRLVGLEDLSDEQLGEMQEQFVRIRDGMPDDEGEAMPAVPHRPVKKGAPTSNGLQSGAHDEVKSG
jgi:low affinity Fe/Cu permease